MVRYQQEKDMIVSLILFQVLLFVLKTENVKLAGLKILMVLSWQDTKLVHVKVCYVTLMEEQQLQKGKHSILIQLYEMKRGFKS